MSNQLKFNTDDLRSQARNLNGISETLKRYSQSLTENLSGLREDWDSEAGHAFFSKYDDSWTTEIESQCLKIDQLAEAVRSAANSYQPVEDEFDRINL